jgi:B12-binding domain/radical SAM domain protein
MINYDFLYDVIFIHPPAFYDFRKSVLFPGAIGSTVNSVQFAKVPIGMLSMADYLDRHGYKVIVDNLADRMLDDRGFDSEQHIRKLSSQLYCIDLHWHHHAQGAIEVAKLCKKLHPESVILLGGLTSTYFHEEIIKKYSFVDAIVRGEGERPLLEFVRNLKTQGKITDTPNLTYRSINGEIHVNPMMEPSTNLDEFDFLRFDLLDPQTSVFSTDIQSRWSLIVCRGCKYSCTTCGGSAYSYKKYFNMEKPSFRSPFKIIEDIKKLNDQGIHRVGLYQDIRMGGEQYWKELMSRLRQEKLDLKLLSMDLLAPADEEFIKEVATIGKPVVLYFGPDSGNCEVRKKQGRIYSNEDILNTVRICHRYHIPVTVFFASGLAGETSETIKDTFKLWNELLKMDKLAICRHSFGGIGCQAPLGGPIIGPVILEPGALAFDNPRKYGYKLLFKDLEEYITALSQPSWHQWLNHETEQLDKKSLIKLIFESIEFSINIRKKYGVYSTFEADMECLDTEIKKFVVDEVDNVMGIKNEEERINRLIDLNSTVNSLLETKVKKDDPFGYKKFINERIFENIHVSKKDSIYVL